MKTITLKSINHPVHAALDLPGSKSVTNRALLLAALAKGRSQLTNFLRSDDSIAFMQSLASLGVEFEEHETILMVDGKGKLESSDRVWCQDAGTAARFLLAACSAFKGMFLLDGTERLRERPLVDLVKVLRALGAEIDKDQLPCTIRGNVLTGGKIHLDAHKSTQFVSALLMISPFMQQPLTLITDNLNRQAYIDITCQMMKSFGVEVEVTKDRYHVPLLQTYHAREYAIEPDLSTASYFFAAAALTAGNITVRGINRQHCLQGDIRFLEVLGKMGCQVTAHEHSVTVQGPQRLHGVEVNMQDFSDPFLTLAAIAPYADSPTLIKGLAHTRLQESDRVTAIATELTKLGVVVKTGADWIQIFPSQPKAATVFSHHDHRVAMSLAILALKTPGIQLEYSGCVAKTCPDFFERINGLLK